MKREPFAIIPLSVLSDERLSGRNVRVYAAISTFSDQEGACWPSHKAIAERCGIRAKDISTHAAHLEERAHLTMTRRGKRQTNIYTLKSDTPESRVSLREGDTPENGVSDTPENGVTSNQTQLTPHVAARGNRRMTKNPRPSEKPPSPVTSFKKQWEELYQSIRRVPYSWGNHAKAGGQIAAMLTAVHNDEDLLTKLAEMFFRDDDKYLEGKGRTIGMFQTRLNKYLDVHTNGNGKADDPRTVARVLREQAAL